MQLSLVVKDGSVTLKRGKRVLCEEPLTLQEEGLTTVYVNVENHVSEKCKVEMTGGNIRSRCVTGTRGN